MASEKKITMHEYNGTDYDTLYPKTIAEQVDGVYGKDEVLSNSTKALYGLTDSVVPDNVLALLSRFNKGLGNEYMWEKTLVTYIAKDSGATSIIDSTLGSSSTTSVTATVYPSYEVNADGTFTLTGDPLTITGSYSSLPSLTNYIGYYGFNSSIGNTQLLEITSSSSVGGTSGTSVYGFSIIDCKKYTVGQSVEHIDYVNSPDANAYPPAVSDGYTYNLLDQLGGVVRIATGSYTGTGTYGSRNPNSLTFDFEPKVVFICSGGNVLGEAMIRGASYQMTQESNTMGSNTLTWSGNSLSWYSERNANHQYNSSGMTYYYIAIG